MAEDPVTERDPLACPPKELALDLTSEAVRLHARNADGEWAELGVAPLAGDDVRAGLDALRRAVEARGSPPIILWLPAEQILVRRYALGPRGHDEALHRIAADAGHPARDLVIALSPADESELVTVLAAFRCTVEEAVEYARRWGFRPGAVSTRVEAGRFGDAGPAFRPVEPARRRAGRAGALAVAAALLVFGLGAWGARGLLPFADPAVGPSEGSSSIVSAPPIVAAAPETTARPAVGAAEAPRTEPGPADLARTQRLEATRQAQPGQSEYLLLPASYSVAGVVALPPPRTATERAVRLALGSDTAGGLPSQQRFMQPAAPQAAADLAPLMAGIERIRAENLAAKQDEILLAASAMAPPSVAGRPVPRPGSRAVTADEEEPLEAEGSDAPLIEGGSDSLLAVLSAPPPPARPDRSGGAGVAVPTVGTTPRVGPIASQTGLSLDATSLIGVIDVKSGREALLRMASGDFVKVARGDQIAGWRVSAIGQDAVRLTRGEKSVTLLLVTR